MHDASEQTYEASDRSEQSSERRCIVRGSTEKDGLIRFAVAPDGTVVPDITEKLPGRGIWVSADADCITEAVAKKMFGRAAKQTVTAPADLLEQTRMLMTQRVHNLLGLAKKAGELVVGTDAVLEKVRGGSMVAVIVAADASAAGLADMQGRSRPPVIHSILTAAALGAAIGRDNAVYMGLTRTKLGTSLMRDFLRLNRLYDLSKEAV